MSTSPKNDTREELIHLPWRGETACGEHDGLCHTDPRKVTCEKCLAAPSMNYGLDDCSVDVEHVAYLVEVAAISELFEEELPGYRISPQTAYLSAVAARLKEIAMTAEQATRVAKGRRQ